MAPFDPYYFTSTKIKFPRVEETLAGHFNRRGRRYHKSVAAILFQQEIAVTRKFLLEKGWLRDHFDLSTLAHICRSNNAELDDFFAWYDTLSENDKFAAVESILHNKLSDCQEGNCKELELEAAALPPLFWPDDSLPTYSNWASEYSWYATIWFRVNVSYALLEYEKKHMGGSAFFQAKVEQFQEAHFRLVQYVAGKRDDELENLQSLYDDSKLQASQFDDDRVLWQLSPTTLQTRPKPLELLTTHFPQRFWTLEAVLENVDDLFDLQFEYDPLHIDSESKLDYKIYHAAIFLLQQCKDCSTIGNLDVQDACYFYYACFTELFYHCLSVSRFDDLYLLTPAEVNVTPLELFYPYDTRVFISWDLPDIFETVATIPLKGRQEQHPTVLGHLIQKTLPFCGMRRALVPTIIGELKRNDAFFNVMSSLMWCLMANMYPHQLSNHRVFSMHRLLRAREISLKRDMMIEAFGREKQYAALLETKPTQRVVGMFKDETTKNCTIICAAFRMWFLQMTFENSVYVRYAKTCIDWDDFVQASIDKVRVVSESNIFVADFTSMARNNLSRINDKVYRLRKKSACDEISSHLSRVLEKVLFKKIANLQHLLDKVLKAETGAEVELLVLGSSWENIPPERVSFVMQFDLSRMQEEIEQSVKENILNALVRIPYNLWLTPKVISILMAKQMGGISHNAVLITLELLDLYDGTGMPKNFSNAIGQYTIREFKIMIWYFHMLTVLGTVKLVPLSADITEKIDYAMHTVRYPQLNGPHEMSPYVYDVFVTICCRKIVTLQGRDCYGHDRIAYDEVRKTFVCAKNHKKKSTTDIEHENSKSLNYHKYAKKRKDRKNARDKRKEFKLIPCKDQQVIRLNLKGYRLCHGKESFMHCPSCGAFHQYKPSYWSGARNSYRCGECCRDERPLTKRTCSFCKTQLSQDEQKQKYLKVIDDQLMTLRDVYFCASHFKMALPYARLNISLTELLKKVQRSVSNQQKRRALKVY